MATAALLLGSCRASPAVAADGSGQPHRPGGRYPGLVAALPVSATGCSPRGPAQGSPPAGSTPSTPCFEVGLRLLVAIGGQRGAAGERQTARKQRQARRLSSRSCSVEAQLFGAGGGPADRGDREQDERRGDRRLGLSLRYRVDHGLLVRGRRDFGDQLPLVVRAIERGLRSLADRTDDTAERGAAERALRRLEGAPHYRVWPEVIIPASVEHRLIELARDFWHLRRRRLLVTSGTRTPASQAEAMYVKFASGGSTRGLYREWRAAQQVERAYHQARSRRRSRREVIAAMAHEIASQVDQGVYISPHLQAGAVDLRSRGLRRRDRAALLRLARSYPWLRGIKLERRPPHFHLWIATEETAPGARGTGQ